MKIFYSPYELLPKTQPNRRGGGRLEGFLLKIQTADFKAGYADCLPWSIFGDESPKVQLQRLRSGRLNELLVRSLYYATLDGQARARRISLFEPRIEVRSHYTCTDLTELTPRLLKSLAERGFETIKIKAGRAPKKEAQLCSSLPVEWASAFKWRIDFNGQGGREFLRHCASHFIDVIEFVEDPEKYSPRSWKTLERQSGVPIAFDVPSPRAKIETYRGPRVIKPARTAVTLRKIDILTNSMDHPVGQSFAFWEAQQKVKAWGRQPRDYGLKTNHLFAPSSFTRAVFDESPYFTFSEGYGIGFDRLLERQKWIAL